MPSNTITVYVAYARKDEPLLTELGNHLSILKNQGVITSWDNRDIEAGEETNSLTTRNLARSQIVLLLISSDFLASDELWQLGVTQAISRHESGVSKVIPIILRPCDWDSALFAKLKALPKYGKPITTWDNQDEAFLDVAKGIRKAIENLWQEPEFTRLQQLGNTEEEVCPYRGLEAFNPDTAEFFFGRQKTVELIAQKLSAANFVPVIGPSGSGKSSVVLAGLVPSLESDWWVLETIRPGVEPMAELRKVMRSLFERKADLNEITSRLKTKGLVSVLELLPKSHIFQTGKRKLLLIIDQFEEVFTICSSEEERAKFVDCITEIQTAQDSPLSIITTMRADFVEQWLGHGDLVQTIQEHAVWLGPLQRDDLIQAITQPAKNQGYNFDPGLLELILEDVKEEKNCLPLLEFALTELWKKRDFQQYKLSLEIYMDMQRLKGALNQRAEEVYQHDLRSDAEKIWVKRICLSLLNIGLNMKDTRKRQPRKTLLDMGDSKDTKDLINDVIEILIKGRLLVATKDDEIDLVHEALMNGWNRFTDWRREDRDLWRMLDYVKREFNFWLSHEQSDDFLMQGGRLSEVTQRWQELKPHLSIQAQDFYQRSHFSRRANRSFQSNINEYKEKLSNLEAKLAKRLQELEETLDLSQDNYAEQLQKLRSDIRELIRKADRFEDRMQASHVASVWLLENKAELVQFIMKSISRSHPEFTRPGGCFYHTDNLQEVHQDIDYYVTWLVDSLKRGEPIDNELKKNIFLDKSIYAKAFEVLQENLSLNSVSDKATDELGLYLDFLVAYFRFLA
ncbi:TIR domain-containing protein [Oscillatoria sp. CS-180]|uniref:nSTAND1 domain-containing NTPase n=1 Tax=Oscillatoria sp. CS-180 TaxID=3021720 RepID=UPI00232FD996|nr:TIR domain-containing protein [Oscillatoria sp. CS-180]MDB9527906.1 TIR domain-containing protein [Oscillatoria sp. CS-180]